MPSYTFGPFRLDTIERVLLRAGKPVPLAHKAYETLRVLVEHGGRVVEKGELLQTVWADTFVEEANIAQNIFKLRKVLGEVHGRPRYIETVSGRGYRFIAKVKLNAGTSDGRTAVELRNPAQPATRAHPDVIDSLAVLPLENTSSEPELEYLSDGLTESLINALAQLPRLRVTARSTVFRLKGRAADPIKLGREIGVRAVFTGRIMRVEGRLVAAMELVDTKHGTQLWGAQHSYHWAGVFEMQDEIAREVSARLRHRLSVEVRSQLLKRHTESVAAYRLYIKGRYYWNKRLVNDLRRALDCFRQAIDEDPTYALAYVGMADCYDQLCGLSALPPHEGYPKARAAVLNALALDDDIAEAHASLGHISMRYEWDWGAANREYRRALELNPSYATAHHWYATYLSAMGRHEEAIAAGWRAQQLDPLSPMINLFLGAHLFFARRYDDALAHIRKTVDSESTFLLAHTFEAMASVYQGKYEEAFAALDRAQQISSEKELASILAIRCYCLARMGRAREAHTMLAELQDRAGHEFVNPYELAQIYVALGEPDEALVQLEHAYNAHVGDLIFLKISPEFDALRREPRFCLLLERIGLTKPASLSLSCRPS